MRAVVMYGLRGQISIEVEIDDFLADAAKGGNIDARAQIEKDADAEWERLVEAGKDPDPDLEAHLIGIEIL